MTIKKLHYMTSIYQLLSLRPECFTGIILQVSSICPECRQSMLVIAVISRGIKQ